MICAIDAIINFSMCGQCGSIIGGGGERLFLATQILIYKIFKLTIYFIYYFFHPVAYPPYYIASILTRSIVYNHFNHI